jgi:hypothetical protein
MIDFRTLSSYAIVSNTSHLLIYQNGILYCTVNNVETDPINIMQIDTIGGGYSDGIDFNGICESICESFYIKYTSLIIKKL